MSRPRPSAAPSARGMFYCIQRPIQRPRRGATQPRLTRASADGGGNRVRGWPSACVADLSTWPAEPSRRVADLTPWVAEPCTSVAEPSPSHVTLTAWRAEPCRWLRRPGLRRTAQHRAPRARPDGFCTRVTGHATPVGPVRTPAGERATGAAVPADLRGTCAMSDTAGMTLLIRGGALATSFAMRVAGEATPPVARCRRAGGRSTRSHRARLAIHFARDARHRAPDQNHLARDHNHLGQDLSHLAHDRSHAASHVLRRARGPRRIRRRVRRRRHEPVLRAVRSLRGARFATCFARPAKRRARDRLHLVCVAVRRSLHARDRACAPLRIASHARPRTRDPRRRARHARSRA